MWSVHQPEVPLSTLAPKSSHSASERKGASRHAVPRESTRNPVCIDNVQDYYSTFQFKCSSEEAGDLSDLRRRVQRLEVAARRAPHQPEHPIHFPSTETSQRRGDVSNSNVELSIKHASCVGGKPFGYDRMNASCKFSKDPVAVSTIIDCPEHWTPTDSSCHCRQPC